MTLEETLMQGKSKIGWVTSAIHAHNGRVCPDCGGAGLWYALEPDGKGTYTACEKAECCMSCDGFGKIIATASEPVERILR